MSGLRFEVRLMSRKVYSLKSLSLLLIVNTSTVALGFSLAYRWTRQHTAVPPTRSSSIALLSTHKDQDGLLGPVHQVRTEAARFVSRSGKLLEGPRQLMEMTTYGAAGDRIENAYYPERGNPPVGEEEYEYDAQGNIISTTVRGVQNSALNKETYRYEFDSVGNWTKRLTSAVVLEEDKPISKPLEVTYRSITYYLDNSTAERPGQDSPMSGVAEESRQTAEELVDGNAAADEGTGGVASRATFAALRRSLEGWLAATNARDSEKQISFYGAKLYSYYRARNVSREFVRADKERQFTRADLIDVRAGAPEIVLDRDNRTAMMRFRKQYVIRSGGSERYGEVLQELRWQRTTDGWEIISERAARVMR
jgi:hypothetical protein